MRQTAKSRAQARGAVKCGRLYMIDLAGSERASQTEVRFVCFKLKKLKMLVSFTKYLNIEMK